MSGGSRNRKKIQERNRIGCALLAGITVFVSCFDIYFLLQIQPVQRSYLYPFPYREAVEQYAEHYHVDRDLAVAVMKNESKFQTEARSHRGAVGLMQLMPETAEWIADQLEDGSFRIDQLHDPETNIRYGIWYLATLEREFGGNDVLAVAAYNAGHGVVLGWMQEHHWGNDFSDINAIPYEETRAYVRKVLKDREKYRILYAK